MRPLNEILEESLALSNSQKGAIASVAIAPTPEMAYGVLTGARNAVSARNGLVRGGYIVMDDDAGTAQLTNRGEDVLTSENLIDDTGELTERGEEIVATYRDDKDEWRTFEAFKYYV